MLQFYLSIIENSEYIDDFEELFYKYKERMLALAWAITKDYHDAEEVLDNAFITIAKKIDRVNFNSEISQEVFVYRVVKNKAIDFYRKKKKQIPISLIEIDSVSNPAFEQNVADQVVGNETYNSILDIISKMPALYSDILYYHLVDELNADKIAKMFDMNLNTVKSRISRGLNLLREKIREAKLHD